MKLQYKMMAALLATGLGAVALVGGVAYVSVNYKVDSLRRQQAAEHFHTYMTAYLAEYGDWQTAIRTESFDRFVRRQEGARTAGNELPSEMLERMPPRINNQARYAAPLPNGAPPPREGFGPPADPTLPAVRRRSELSPPGASAQEVSSTSVADADRIAPRPTQAAEGPPPDPTLPALRRRSDDPAPGAAVPAEADRAGAQWRDSHRPPRDGYGPPRDGQRPPRDGYGPPQDGQRPPRDGYGPPQDGQRPPRDGYGPPHEGQRPPRDGYGPPQDGQRPPRDGYAPPQDGQRPPRDDYGPSHDGQRAPRESHALAQRSERAPRDGYGSPHGDQRPPRDGHGAAQAGQPPLRDGYGPPPQDGRPRPPRDGYGPPPESARAMTAADAPQPAPGAERTNAAPPQGGEGGDRPPPRRRGDGPPPFRFVLADADYKILLGGGAFRPGDTLPENLRASARPIMVKDRTVAYMSSEGALSLTPQEQKYLDALYNSLLWGIAAAAGLAILLGVLLSRGLSRSLSNLTRAVRGMQEGDLRQQVPVKGKDEVADLATAFNAMSEQLAHSHEELQTSHQTILQQAEQLRELSIRDALTQLYNRRHFDEQANTLFNHAVRYKRPLSLVICDIDHFKKINDTYSHATGDAVLRHVGTILRNHMRLSDLVARYGGEEFVMAFPETPGPQAAALCDKLRTLIESYPWHEVHPDLKVTMSMGVYADIAAGSAETMLQKADALLYRAKETGRNRVCFA